MKIFKFLSALTVSVIVNTGVAYAEDPVFDKLDQPEAHCLALNIYHEARGSSYADQIAVADVVLNRVNDHRYPMTICDVVKQARYKNGVLVKHKCQFSWFCDGKPDTPKDLQRWGAAQAIAWNMRLYGRYQGITEGATHYHAHYVSPSWVSDLEEIGQIGAHIYYKWPTK